MDVTRLGSAVIGVVHSFRKSFIHDNLGFRGTAGKARIPLAARAALEKLEVRMMLVGTPFISEFLAMNATSIVDENGDSSDWIELQNPLPAAQNLDGYYLTDEADNLTKWKIPAVSLPANGYTVLFASGKDRFDPAYPLHTNFLLNGGGGYLALVAADGTTVLSSYNYPTQAQDISYGMSAQQTKTTLLAPAANMVAKVPIDNKLDLATPNWRQPSFTNTTGWIGAGGTAATTGVGYEQGASQSATVGFNVRVIDINGGSDGSIDNMAEAQSILNGTAPAGAFTTVTNSAKDDPVVNHGDGGAFGGDKTFPNGSGGSSADNASNARTDYAFRALSNLFIPAGTWTIDVGSDEGFMLKIPGVSFSYKSNENFTSVTTPTPADTLVYGGRRTFGHTTGVFTVGGDGLVTNLVFDAFERNGPDSIEISFAQGAKSFPNNGSSGFFPLTETLGWKVRSPNSPPPAYGTLIKTQVYAQLITNNQTSIYMRQTFGVPDPNSFDTLRFRIRYDDGFIAYLNGTEIARRNAPANPVFNSKATAKRVARFAIEWEDIEIPVTPGLLVAGTNLLAVQGLNDATNSEHFLLEPAIDGLLTLPATESYYTTPSPASPNVSGSALGVVSDTQFTVDRGFYDAPFQLEITSNTPGATIRYTTNGAPPTATTGTLYTGPVTIASTTTLRAAAFKTGYISSNVDTQSYLFVDDIIHQSPTGAAPPGWPASWGSNSVDYGMDPDIVNSAKWGPQIKDSLKSLPAVNIAVPVSDLFDSSTGIYANAAQDGRLWERAASVEFINPDGSDGFQVNAGLRIRGGFSRSGSNPKHAFRLFFRAEYGDPTLNFPLFGEGAVDSFDKLDLRTDQNYSWSFQGDSRDIFVRDIFNHDQNLDQGQIGPHMRNVNVYINGQYWGLYQFEERPEARFAASYYGGDVEDYDTIKVDTNAGYTIFATDGDMVAWTELWNQANAGLGTMAAYQKMQGNNPDGTRNPDYPILLDVDNLIDSMIVIFYGGNLDAPTSNFLGNNNPNNWFGTRPRSGEHGFRFYIHDAEHTLLTENVNINRMGPWSAGNSVSTSSPQSIFQKLWGNAEFRLRWADHVHAQFFNSGVLTPAANVARFMREINDVSPAVVAESARWGDAKTGSPYTKDTFTAAYINVANNFFNVRSGVVLSQFQNASPALYPSVAAPEYNQFGGTINPGFGLVITKTGATGTIYYTADGSDPRLLGGGINPTALVYSGPVTLNQSTRVMARVLGADAQTWSALTDATFSTNLTAVKISEVMYNPAPPAAGPYTADDFEFIEFLNTGANALNLAGAEISQGVTFTFPAMMLQPGQRTVIVRNQAAFESRYGAGINIAGVYTGLLSNDGEAITFSSLGGETISTFTYSDGWYSQTDGDGFSLVRADPNAATDLNTSAAWRSSNAFGGTPGTADTGIVAPASVVINEVVPNATGGNGDWIELKNTTNQTIDLGGWFLSDSRLDLKKYQIQPNTTIDPQGFLVFDSLHHFGTAGNPGANTPFDISSLSANLYLTNSDGQGGIAGYRDFADFSGSPVNAAFGVFVKSNGATDFTEQLSPTLGEINGPPHVGPVVISELMYNPLPGKDEFIELQNITDTDVQLFDPGHLLNTWKFASGVNFTFPGGAVVPALGAILVVPIDPAVFRSKYSIPVNVPIYGPYSGNFDNNGEDIKLSRPGEPVGPLVPYILVDKLRYDNIAPWPTLPDGSGPSLSRLAANMYGNDPVNWAAGVNGGTPGTVNIPQYAPSVNIVGDSAIDQGGQFVGAGLFTDLNTGQTWSATVNYGDGGGIQPLTLNPDKTFALSHPYANPGVYSITVTVTDSLGGVGSDSLSLAVRPGPLVGTSGDDHFTLRIDPSGVYVQFFINPPDLTLPNFIVPLAALNVITINSGGGDDSLTIDQSNGNTIPVGGVNFNGETNGALGDSLLITGSTESVAAIVDGVGVSIGSSLVTTSGIESMRVDGSPNDDSLVIAAALAFSPAFNGGDGDDSLAVNAGVYTLNVDAQTTNARLSLSVAGGATVNLDAPQHLASLTLADGAVVNVGAGGGNLLRTSELLVQPGGILDLADNDAIVDAAELTKASVFAALFDSIKAGRNLGAWNGVGIRSSAAAADVQGLTGLGIIINEDGGQPVMSLFDGESVGLNSILMKYTWNGDSDLNGVVDADDYFHIDYGFAAELTGWFNGDYDYSGASDADDYFLVDTSFTQQTGPQSGQSARARKSTPLPARRNVEIRKTSRHPGAKSRGGHHPRALVL